MPLLKFPATAVRRVVEHALAARMPGTPAVLLVHDDGVYLMSNGHPRDMDESWPGRSFTAYAQGCDPRVNRDWWDRSRDLVGGDDFAETLPWCEAIKERLDGGAKWITIAVRDDKVELK